MFKNYYMVLIIFTTIIHKNLNNYIYFVNFFDKSNFIFLFFTKNVVFFYFFSIFRFNLDDFFFNCVKSNNSLLNCLSFYHPLLLFYFFKKNLYFFIFKKGFVLKKNIYKYSYTTLLPSFYLGVWWASQELLWGGFWNWDYVEYVFFVSVLMVMFYKHNLFFIVQNKVYFLKSFFIVIFFYFLINRTSLINSQHSFSVSPLFSLNINCLVIFLILYMLTFFIKVCKSKINTFNIFLFLNLTIISISGIIFVFSNTEIKKMIVVKFLLKYMYTYTLFMFRHKIFFQTQILFSAFVLFKNIKSMLISNKKKRHLLYFLLIIFFFFFFISLNLNDINVDTFKYNIFWFKKNYFFSENYENKNNFFAQLDCIQSPMNFKVFFRKNYFYFNVSVFNSQIKVDYILSFGVNIIVFLFFSKMILFLNQKSFNFMYITKVKLDKPSTMFKKRNLLKIWQNHYIFNKKNFYTSKIKRSYIFYNFNSTIELFWYKFFLKKLRKILKKKKAKGFVSIVNNHSYTLKSKNSRMGKGKGKHTRFVSRQKILKPVFTFYKISFCRLKKFTQFLNKKCKNNFLLF